MLFRNALNSIGPEGSSYEKTMPGGDFEESPCVSARAFAWTLLRFIGIGLEHPQKHQGDGAAFGFAVAQLQRLFLEVDHATVLELLEIIAQQIGN